MIQIFLFFLNPLKPLKIIFKLPIFIYFINLFINFYRTNYETFIVLTAKVQIKNFSIRNSFKNKKKVN